MKKQLLRALGTLVGFVVAAMGLMWAQTPASPSHDHDRDRRQATVRVLHSFSGGTGNGDGMFPKAGLAMDSKGNLYGTTSIGGNNVGENQPGGCGTVFKITPGGKYTQLYQLLWTCDPEAGVVLDAAGNLYGVASYSINNAFVGALFSIDPSGHETDLWDFLGYTNAGLGQPTSTPIMDANGNLFMAAQCCGDYVSNHQWGGIFEWSCCGVAGTPSYVYQFQGGSDGANPARSRLLLDPSGNLYGLASGGGDPTCQCGVVFKVTPSSGQETTLFAFHGNDGSGPLGDLLQDSSGNLYGVTQFGGTHGNGVVFRLSDAGQETVLYSFRGGMDGRPQSGVILDEAGNLYGTTPSGGAYNRGSVFRLDPSGRYHIVHSFTGEMDGGHPFGTLLRDAQGHLYGTAADGGELGQGTVFEIIPQ